MCYIYAKDAEKSTKNIQICSKSYIAGTVLSQLLASNGFQLKIVFCSLNNLSIFWSNLWCALWYCYFFFSFLNFALFWTERFLPKLSRNTDFELLHMNSRHSNKRSPLTLVKVNTFFKDPIGIPYFFCFSHILNNPWICLLKVY